ncbi:MAG: carboxy terminal-processing peptidase [Agriterribacter sp.]
MRKLIVVITCLVSVLHTAAQSSANNTNDQTAQNAFLIYRMAEKFHVQPRPLNDNFSADLFNTFLKRLDEDKIFFTQEHIASFQSLKYILDDEIKSQKKIAISNIADVYMKQLKWVDSIIAGICKKPLDFKTNEKFSAAEDTSYAKDNAALKIKLQKAVKAQVLMEILNTIPSPTPKQVDSLELIYRAKVAKVYKRSINRILQRPEGFAIYAGNVYCECIAVCYDPHTNYFSLTEKENFESELGHKSMVFGFSLKGDDNDENVVIDDLEAGSAAFKSGQLNKGDKITAVQWEGKETVDVKDASVEEMRDILDESNHHKLSLTVEKSDGTTREVALSKSESSQDDDNNKVKSFLLKGAKTVGYISLPSFYEDWENDNAVNGCANDVAKEIIKLKKENINALIIDVRFNGGGSVMEAVDLAGLFIDAGPIGIVKSREPKLFTLKDINRGTIYDGPLLYVINGYSASASEIVAATLQDYNRAVIVGSPSYGKATGQIILPLDTTINLENSDPEKIKSDYFIKMTTSKLYRLTGKTAQFTGVIPDVVLPDMIEVDPHREANEPFAMPADIIDGNKFYKPYSAIASLQQVGNNEIANNEFFTALSKYIVSQKSKKTIVDIPLNINAAKQLYNADDRNKKPETKADNFFTVANNAYDEERIKIDNDSKEINDQWKQSLEKDPYIKVTYKIALQLIK